MLFAGLAGASRWAVAPLAAAIGKPFQYGWARPEAGTPSTHILKPDPPEYPGLVANEAFAQRAAALAGLPAAQVRLDTFGGRTVLVVTRFDRVMAGGVLTRVHQEDGCQALGLEPSGLGKYQSPAGLAS